ncbi:hypothetical protein LTR37_013005 [Vermiconidia calcicola]|uniref:Uncharacterized protein n=1 Tax=Vermiconidia calcicola TaxID=1690605 RepID=A0ACC3MYD5_9PEZI|nr:hypothetical protein LTR37_013005 [Vermiconidia calcicola]
MAQLQEHKDGEQQSQTEGNSNSADDESSIPYIQRIPPEIRNHIYELVIKSRRPVNINATGWPGIVDTCQKIRAEALPLYLNNIFFVTVVDFNHDALIRWLEGFKLVPAELKKLTKTVRIICAGNTLKLEGYCTSGDPIEGKPKLAPNFEYWDSIIERISAAGFVATQLEFPGVLKYDKDVALRPGFISFFLVGTQKHLLNKFVLTPLLRARRLLDIERPPVNVLHQLKRDCMMLGLPRQHFREVSAEISPYITDTPTDWFALWRSETGERLEDDKMSSVQGISATLNRMTLTIPTPK